MKTTIETVAVCSLGDIDVMAQASGVGIAIVKDREKKDACGNCTSLYLTLDQAQRVLECLVRAIKEYQATPKREFEE